LNLFISALYCKYTVHKNTQSNRNAEKQGGGEVEKGMIRGYGLELEGKIMAFTFANTPIDGASCTPCLLSARHVICKHSIPLV